jgi:hypothetical protein
MDEITLPVQYDKLDIEGIKSHLRYITTIPKSGHCAEIFLCDSKISVPVAKKIYKTKSDQLIFLFRSGPVSRDNLEDLKNTFIKQSYDLICSYTTKNKLIKRLSLPISVTDPMLPVIGVNFLKTLAMQLKSRWPLEVSIGYAFGDEDSSLPGELHYRDIIAQAGYKIGFATGKIKSLFML